MLSSLDTSVLLSVASENWSLYASCVGKLTFPGSQYVNISASTEMITYLPEKNQMEDYEIAGLT